MEPLSLLVVLVFGFGGGFVFKTEQCKMKHQDNIKIEQNIK